MTFKDLFSETVTALSANKARSGLTMLGIVLGIASVIAMVAIGNGAKMSIESNIQSLGSNLIMVTPGATRNAGGFGVSTGRGSSKTLTASDADVVESRVDNVVAVAKELSGRYQVTAKGTNTNTTVSGVSANYIEVRNLAVASGTFFSDGQDSSRAKVAVLGPTVRDDLYGEGADAVGNQLRIHGVLFTVIGVTESKGGSGFTNQDDLLYIPFQTAARYLAGDDYLSVLDIQASGSESLAQIQADVTTLLLDRHKIKDASLADFSIISQADIVSTASTVTSTFTLLLAAVAAISLIVGGIGIMNMMLTSVTERTREIGLRKAVGATKADISRQFLMESILLTVLGGVAGIVLGWLVACGITLSGVLTASVSLSSVALSFGVSAIIGISFGWYPARRAANMNPIDALRFE